MDLRAAQGVGSGALLGRFFIRIQYLEIYERRCDTRYQLGAAVLPIAPLHLRDRTDDKLFEHCLVEIGKPLEIQTAFAHLVLANLA